MVWFRFVLSITFFFFLRMQFLPTARENAPAYTLKNKGSIGFPSRSTFEAWLFLYINHIQSLLFLDVMFFATLSCKNSMRINYSLCRLASLHYIHQFVALWLLSVASSDKHTFRFIFWCTPFESPMWCYFWEILRKVECGFKCFLLCKCKICCYTTCSHTATAK